MCACVWVRTCAWCRSTAGGVRDGLAVVCQRPVSVVLLRAVAPAMSRGAL